MTIDDLKRYGADTDTGLHRCMGDEAFYLELVNMAIDDEGFSELAAAVAQNNLDTAFEEAHALKGVFGNIALTPIYELLCELTELLRNKKEADYSEYVNKIMHELYKLKSLA